MNAIRRTHDVTCHHARTIDELLAEARAGVARVPPEQIEAERAAGALVVDIRPTEQRERDGPLPGAIVIQRNVLEWRLDPASPDRITGVAYDRRIIVVCNQGYASSLAAASLRSLGLRGATDLIDGYQGLLHAAPAANPARDAGPSASSTARTIRTSRPRSPFRD